MKNTFIIIDDDINVTKMLSHIISINDFGRVLEELDSGEHAISEILFYNPDIVLIDLLLPYKDGVKIIEETKAMGYSGKFIMISQVEDEDIISKAYENGIVFFINKPINIIEAKNIIKGVCHNIELERSVELIKNTVFSIKTNESTISEKSDIYNIQQIFKDIGIINEIGCKELEELIVKIINLKKNNKTPQYQLQELYREISKEDLKHNNISTQAKTIEQRVRRTVLKALENIASLGYEDYYNSIFIEYSTLLFDLKQVKQEIKYLDNPKEERGKINIKKFIEGVISKINY